jgi:aspartate racemase
MILGLVGGIGPESTIDYYRRILAVAAARGMAAPSMVIDSLDVQRGLRLVGGDLPGLAEYLLESLHRLAGAGVDFAAVAANTPHVIFDDLAAQSPVPLLSIVETCADEAVRRGLRRLGLLGTRFTMAGDVYPTVFGRRGLTVVSPAADDVNWLHERYVGELIPGVFRDETRAGVIRIVERLRDDGRVDGIILGGTELPLLLRDATIAGLPTLDTTKLHVDAIVDRLAG